LESVTIVAPWAHLTRRFFGSLRPGGPSPVDEAWAVGVLAPSEAVLWRRMSAPDRRHAVAVARAVTSVLGDHAVRSVRAAALLHDVGKVEAGFGPLRRAAVTLAAMVVGREAAAARWSTRGGVIGRAGAYLRHDEIGAALLTEAGSDPLTVAWAREHHLPTARWTVPADIGAALKAADDDGPDRATPPPSALASDVRPVHGESDSSLARSDDEGLAVANSRRSDAASGESGVPSGRAGSGDADVAGQGTSRAGSAVLPPRR
jgi:hypothetical protein